MQYLQLEFIIHKKELMRKKLLASLFIISTLFGLYELNNKAFSFPLKNLPIKGLKNKIPSQTNKVNLPENATFDDYLTAIKKQYTQKKYKTVVELSNKAIQLEPEGEKVHIVYYYKALANEELGYNQKLDYKEQLEYLRSALEDYKNIRRLNRDNDFLEAAYTNNLLIYSSLKENENLVQAGKKALKKFENDPSMPAYVCSVFSERKEIYKETLKVCDKAISLNPKDTKSLLVRAAIKIDDLGDKEGGCYDVKQGSLLGDKKSKKLYSQFCATPREQAKEECNNYENMIVMGMNPAAILQGQVAMSGGNPKVMEKIRIMRSMCPDVFESRTPSGLFNNNNY